MQIWIYINLLIFKLIIFRGFVLSKGYQHSDAFFLSGEIDRQLGLYDIAEEKLLRAMTYQVFTPKVFFSLGLIYNEKRDYQKAIRCLKKFLFSIETPEAHFQLGRALMDTNNLNDAAIHLSRAIILDPEEPDYYLLRARWYELQGLQELAQDDYKNVLKIDPTFHLEHVEELRESEELMYTNTVLQKRELLDKMLP